MLVSSWIYFEIWSWNRSLKYLSSIIFLFPLIPFSPNNLPKSWCNFPFCFFILQRTLHMKIFYSYNVLFSCRPGFLSLSALLSSYAFLNYSVSLHMKTWSPQSCHLNRDLWFLWSMRVCIYMANLKKCLHSFLSHKCVLVLERTGWIFGSSQGGGMASP